MQNDYSLVGEHGFIEKLITDVKKGDNFYHGRDGKLYRAKSDVQMTPTGDGYFLIGEDEDFDETLFATAKNNLSYMPKFFVIPDFTTNE